MTTANTIPNIDIPSATDDPAAYVNRLLEIAGDRDLFEVLATTPVRAHLLCGDTPTELIERAPGDGEWSAALTIGHLCDVDIVYGFRWRLVLTEPDPVYPGYDEERWASLPRLPFWQAIDIWTGLRAANVALLRSMAQEDWQRTGRHAEQNGETVEIMIRKVVGHDVGHLNQIYRALRSVRSAAGLEVDSLDHAYGGFDQARAADAAGSH